MVKLLYIVPIVLLCFVASSVNAQEDLIKRQVDSLQYCGADFLDCSSVIWRIIAHEKKAIPYLLEKLSDTTLTSTHLKCKLTDVRVGDLAYVALKEIISIPMFAVTKQQFDTYDGNGCQGRVYVYIEENREKFKTQVKNWITNNMAAYRWVRFKPNELSACDRYNKITGMFELDYSKLKKNGYKTKSKKNKIQPKQK